MLVLSLLAKTLRAGWLRCALPHSWEISEPWGRGLVAQRALGTGASRRLSICCMPALADAARDERELLDRLVSALREQLRRRPGRRCGSTVRAAAKSPPAWGSRRPP